MSKVARKVECRVELNEIVIRVGEKILLQIDYTDNDDGSITIESPIDLASKLLDAFDQVMGGNDESD